MRIADTRAGRAALGAAAASGVKHMAHRFIVGETPASAMGVLRHLWDRGVASSVDLLGEATVTATEADRYADPETDHHSETDGHAHTHRNSASERI